MLWIINQFIENIFPERLDHKLVRSADIDDLKLLLDPAEHGEFISLFRFHDPLIRATIHEAKFQQNEKAWKMLGYALSQHLKHQPNGTIVIPIPLFAKRLKERGHNQVTSVMKEALKQLTNIELREDILYRARDTKPQTSLSRGERLKNVQGAFSVTEKADVSGRHVIILDDVATTGATMKEVRALLAPLSPASITLLALAH